MHLLLCFHLCLSAKHIIKIDGKSGLFKGLAPRLCAGTIGTIVHSKVLQVRSAHQALQRFISCRPLLIRKCMLRTEIERNHAEYAKNVLTVGKIPDNFYDCCM